MVRSREGVRHGHVYETRVGGVSRGGEVQATSVLEGKDILVTSRGRSERLEGAADNEEKSEYGEGYDRHEN